MYGDQPLGSVPFSALGGGPVIYNESVSIAAVASIIPDVLAQYSEALTIGVVADCVPSTLNTYDAAVTIGGVAGIAVVVEAVFENSVTIAGVSDADFETEGVFGQLTVAATAGIAVSATGSFSHALTIGASAAITSAVVDETATTTSAVAGIGISASGIFNRSISDTITFSQSANCFRAVASTLTFHQTVSVKKVQTRKVQQTLLLNQTITRNIDKSLHVNDTLIFNPGLTKQLPIVGSGGQITYPVPPVQVVLIPKKCLVVVSSSAQTVILPCPKFSDSQANLATLDLKRTMTGDTFTYVRKTDLQKLVYSFDVGSKKAYEMKQFLVDHSHEVLTVTNWKGEVWKVVIANNPISFETGGRWQNKGELYQFTLELEGVKVN